MPANFSGMPTFNMNDFGGDKDEWYKHCHAALDNAKLLINPNSEDANEITLAEHFKHPTSGLCDELWNFTSNPQSIFGEGWQKTMVTSYS